jgi:pantetheine-phosphate adenylyltransferase
MSTGIYPGSFDPVTLGHLDVIRRSCAVFERLVVGVLENTRKSPTIDAASRADIIRAAVADELGPAGSRVEVTTLQGLTVEFARTAGAGFIVRGLRAVSDFESELQMAHLNRKLAPEVDTVFLMTGLEHAYVSSSLVREIASFGGDGSGLVPKAVLEPLGGGRRPEG